MLTTSPAAYNSAVSALSSALENLQAPKAPTCDAAQLLKKVSECWTSLQTAVSTLSENAQKAKKDNNIFTPFNKAKSVENCKKESDAFSNCANEWVTYGKKTIPDFVSTTVKTLKDKKDGVTTEGDKLIEAHANNATAGWSYYDKLQETVQDAVF